MGLPKKKVFVLDADMAHCLAIVRSLRRMGIVVDVASHIPSPTTCHSNSVDSVYIYPDPLKNEQEFISWLLQHLKLNHYDLVIPVTERTIVPILNYKVDTLLPGIAFAISSIDSLDIVLDKTKTLLLAEKLKIPVPKSLHLSNIDQIDNISAYLRYPIVIKPSRSIGGDGQVSIPLKVDYAGEKVALKSKTAHLLRFGDVILQEYIIGKGIGVEIIADRGKIKYFFQHERIHEVPLSGGGSTLRKGVAIIPELKAATVKIIEALKWHGVAMVEFKFNPANRSFALMEINGRLWGSLPLAVASGADFPKMIYELYVEGKIRERKAPELGIVCRKLSHDIYWHELVFRKIYQPEVVQLPSYSKVVRDLALMLLPHHRFDIQTWSDIKPGIVDIFQILRDNTRRMNSKLIERRFFKSQAKKVRSKEFESLLKNAQQVLFVCYGNINRSALAERIFQQKVSDNKIKCISAGFHEKEGRPADPIMIKVANEKGFDLTSHHSRHVSKEMFDESDLIFVMEKNQYDRIKKLFKNLPMNKVYLLGAMVDGGAEIEDPYGKHIAEYKKCFIKIRGCVDSFISHLRK